MTDLTLATKLAEALQVAIDMRDGERPVHHAVIIVSALNECFERLVHSDVAAAGIDYHSMTYLEWLDWVGAKRPEPPGQRPVWRR
jgi:hypothetical protein